MIARVRVGAAESKGNEMLHVEEEGRETYEREEVDTGGRSVVEDGDELGNWEVTG